jgi:2-keto-4-pentenoate hydratase
MTDDGTASAARALAQARRSGTLAPEPEAALLADPAAAGALRRAAERALGWRTVGYKVGATSRAIQQRLGADGPFHSALFAERSHGDGAVLELPEGVLGIECEIAVRLGRDLAAPPADLDAARAAVAAVHPAIELVGQRWPGGIRPPVGRCIADFALSVAFVAGAGVPPAALPDLAELPVTARIDGAVRAEGNGAEVLGHPLNALIELARGLHPDDPPLVAGSWVSTGTCVGIVPVTRGQEVVAAFGPLGVVRALAG